MKDIHKHIARPDQFLRISVCLILMTVLSFPVYAQTANAKLDTGHYRIGEWIPLHLEVSAQSNSDIIWPMIDVTIGDLEVLDRTDVDSTIIDDLKTLRQSLTLTVFDSGYYPVPAFDFIVDRDTVSTIATIVRVHGVQIDSLTAEIKPIKDPFDAPLTFKEVLPWLLGGFGLIALGLLALLIYKKLDKETEPIVVPKITIPAHVWALRELEELKNSKLWQKGEIKPYYIRLTDILRAYIELRYHQPAMESTTDEIMDRLSSLSISKSLLERTKSTLVISDLVKFAKSHPLADEHERAYETVLEFVESTALIENQDVER